MFSVQTFFGKTVFWPQTNEQPQKNDQNEQQIKNIDRDNSGFPPGINALLIKEAIEKKYHYSLWLKLLQGMKEEHEIAKKNLFLNSLIDGGMTFCSKAYVIYLCNLYLIHLELEKSQKIIIEKYGEGYFVFPELFRAEKLLNDIKIWSIFNDTVASKFSEETDREKFVIKILSLTDHHTHNFIAHLSEVTREDPIYLVGCLFALYGTIMSGGQYVREGWQGTGGVKSGYICRIKDKDAVVDNVFFEGENGDITSKKPHEIPVEQSISFFTFPEGFSIPNFKQMWHENLNSLPQKLKLEGLSLENFEKKLIQEANLSISTLTSFIASMLINIENGIL